MAAEEEGLMLSGIQHFHFCKRQWAIIHIEQQWEDNVRTVEGQHIHYKADQPFTREKRGNKLIVRAMPVKSESLNINGICDVVEFLKDEHGVEIVGTEGKFVPYPVEYKRGKPKSNEADLLQLAAQAICLEEMLLCEVSIGYMYYDEIKHRVEVPLTSSLKQRTRDVIDEMHSYYKRKHTPKVKTGAFCLSCSLQHVCLPKLMSKHSVKRYVEGKLIE